MARVARLWFTSVSASLAAIGLCSYLWGFDSKDDDSKTVHVLSRLLDEQTASWNRGDIAGFMQTYWNSPQMTFSSGGKTERGWQATLDRYRTRYPDQRAMGKLQFSDLETTQLSPDSALMLGRWSLEKEKPVDGNFTLVWRRFPNGWKIIHDHSSISTSSP
jgi:beta-aspartyl-peptidase (threonine type)